MNRPNPVHDTMTFRAVTARMRQSAVTLATSSEVDRVAANLRPLAMRELASSSSRSDFAHAIDPAILLVPVDDPAGEFALGLDESATLDGASIDPSMESATLIANVDLPFAQRPRLTATVLRTRLLRSAHVALPLWRRRDAGRSFSTRVTVGRARNSDIVLRADTVSPLHAWFTCDDSDVFYVFDADSSGGTRVNGKRVAPRGCVPVVAGDEVHFGEVAALYCFPEMLWDALAPSAEPGIR